VRKEATYRDKRDPARTPEPFSAERKPSGRPTLRGRFVVHQHAATRMHFDLRIEIAGALKSFAVPKGPSLDPREKRLAINTEDHPLEYLDFEDVIPEGNYGAGAMIVWDTGRVIYLEGSAEDGIARAKIDFQLDGHKLHGRFGLIHTGARAKPGSGGENHWLLVKKEDQHASQVGDIAVDQPESVLSGMRVDELARARERFAELEARAASLGAPVGDLDTKNLTPMLCAGEGAELHDPERIYELKLDGVRIVADRRGEEVELRYRKQRSATMAYPEVARAVRALAPGRVVLDGEIVAFDDKGHPSFQLLGRRIHLSEPSDVVRAGSEVPVTYMVFDLLQLGARDLRGLPLLQRKALLRELVPRKGILRLLDHIEDDGNALYQFCVAQGLEGVVAKKKRASYRAGPQRGPEWVKIKCVREGDFVIVGWEESEKARKLRNLLLAAYDGPDLVLRGKAGSGLADSTIDWLLATLGPMEIKRCAASGDVTRHGPRHYVRPELVANIEYAGFSDGGTLRFPVFKGIRADVSPAECVLLRGREVDVDKALSQRPAQIATARVELPRAKDLAVRAVLTNQDKVFWPEEGYTKGDLCDYYARVAEVLVPFLKDRPIVMVRHPDGVAGKSFFQWHVPKGTPDWVRSLEVRMEGERGKSSKRCFLVDDIDGLLFIANLGCIPIHVLATRAGHREQADFLTIDFDIGEQPFRHAVTLALGLRELLGEIGLPGFPKTSGQSGLHVLVPMGGVPFDTAKVLAELLGRILWARFPEIATMERVRGARGAHVYIDTGQTGRSRTIVSPYSVRAYRGAQVSTPLQWDEVHAALDPSRFTIFTVAERVATLGDPMQALLTTPVDVPAAVAKLERLFRPPP
jgi:bifunctional non-homologous end joining protein LigD